MTRFSLALIILFPVNPNESWRGNANVNFSTVGRQLLKAEVIPVPSETNITNNSLTLEIFVRR